VIIRIQDNEPGMTATVLEKLVDLFLQLDFGLNRAAWIVRLALQAFQSMRRKTGIRCETPTVRAFRGMREKLVQTQVIAVAIWVRTGCRGGTPGWGLRPHTPFDPIVLT